MFFLKLKVHQICHVVGKCPKIFVQHIKPLSASQHPDFILVLLREGWKRCCLLCKHLGQGLGVGEAEGKVVTQKERRKGYQSP